jgi:diadenosine tetraphosphate (Ap4A) HIT family hydrolase
MRVLWSNGTTNLILDKENFLVVQTNPKKPLKELSSAQIVDHEKTVGKLENLFQKIWGCGDFGRWMPLGQDGLSSFIFPARQNPSKPDGVDFGQKVDFMLHTLSEKKSDSFTLEKKQADRIEQAAQTILNSSPDPVPIEDIILSPLNVEDAVKNLTSVLNADPLPPVPAAAPKLTKKCGVFCNPDIVAKQLVHQGKKVFVTCNNRPYTDLHLMVLPKKHKEKLSENTATEIIEKHQIFQKIFKVAQKNNEMVGVMTRTGPRSGQTQSHLYDHVVCYGPQSKQLWQTNWLNELTGKNVPPLSEEEMSKIKATWTSHLQNRLRNRI